MKVNNATWDEKVTGLRTCEIVFERGDNFDAYPGAVVEKEFSFLVAKVPGNDLKLVHQLEDNGYRYLETQIKLSFEVNQLDRINPAWSRLLNGFTCQPVTTSAGIQHIESEIKENMFESDRYTLDPYWPKGISSIRYSNWIRDLFGKEGTRFFEINHNGEGTGFFATQEESVMEGICPIAGIYKRYKGSGFIFSLVWFWLDINRKEGKKKVFTSVSSNNRIMLSSLSKAFSFRICKSEIVLRKVVPPND